MRRGIPFARFVLRPIFGRAMEFNLGGENEGKTMNPLSRLNNAAPPILSGLLLACLPLAPIAQAVDPPQERGRPTAILVSPIHEAQVVRGDDGRDHVEYELLVVNAVEQPVTLTSLTVLDPAAKELTRIDGPVLVAATQTLLDKKPVAEIPASAAVSVDGRSDRAARHCAGTGDAPARLQRSGGHIDCGVRGPARDRRPRGRDQPPPRHRDQASPQGGWLARHHRVLHTQPPSGSSNRRRRSPHRDRRDVRCRLGPPQRATGSMRGDGATNEQFYVYGADVLAVADGTVVSVRTAEAGRDPEQGDDPENVVGLRRQPGHAGDRPQGLRGLRAPAAGESAGEGRRHREGRRDPGQDREHRPVSRSPPALRSLEPPRHLHRT